MIFLEIQILRSNPLLREEFVEGLIVMLRSRFCAVQLEADRNLGIRTGFVTTKPGVFRSIIARSPKGDAAIQNQRAQRPMFRAPDDGEASSVPSKTPAPENATISCLLPVSMFFFCSHGPKENAA